MQLIFYYVVGQRANATNINKLTDRCKILKKKQEINEQINTWI